MTNFKKNMKHWTRTDFDEEELVELYFVALKKGGLEASKVGHDGEEIGSQVYAEMLEFLQPGHPRAIRRTKKGKMQDMDSWAWGRARDLIKRDLRILKKRGEMPKNI